MRKKYCIDIDGTICITRKYHKDMQKNYKNSIPKKEVIKKINELYYEGHIIILYSSRHWIDFELTQNWLKENDIKYHTLILGKPVAHYYVDEKEKLLNVKEFLDE